MPSDTGKQTKVSKPKRDVRNGKAVRSQGTHRDVAQDDHEAQLAHILLRAPESMQSLQLRSQSSPRNPMALSSFRYDNGPS